MNPATSRGQWNTELPPANGEAMTRLPSQESVGAHSHRTSNSYDDISSARTYPSLSQKAFDIASSISDASDRSISPDNSALYTPTQNNMDLQAFDHFPYPVGEDFNGSQAIYHRGDFKLDAASNTALPAYNIGIFSTSADGYAPLAAIHGPLTRDAMSFDHVSNSPVWDGTSTLFPHSQESSPIFEDDWNFGATQMQSDTTSPPRYSPPLESTSPKGEYSPDYTELNLPPFNTGDRVSKKPIGPRLSKVASDLARNQLRPEYERPGYQEEVDESSLFANRESILFGNRTNPNNDNTARDHHLYQNVSVQADGLYHCPFEGKEGCAHKGEKLKCNYEYEIFLSLAPYSQS